MSATLERPHFRVPPEFTGLGRAFRNVVADEDRRFDKAIGVIAFPLRARLKHHHKLRHEQIAGALRAYRLLVPSTFRLGEVATVPDREMFSVREARLGVTWMNAEAWDNPDHHEPGVAVATFSLTLQPGPPQRALDARGDHLAAHALARRFERARDRSHEAVVADLARLLDAEGGDTVGASDGRWVGSVIGMKGPGGPRQVRAVRTWRT